MVAWLTIMVVECGGRDSQPHDIQTDRKEREGVGRKRPRTRYIPLTHPRPHFLKFSPTLKIMPAAGRTVGYGLPEPAPASF